MAPHIDAVLGAIAAPDHHEPDERPHRERFYQGGCRSQSLADDGRRLRARAGAGRNCARLWTWKVSNWL
jgi:hypothetical protein